MIRDLHPNNVLVVRTHHGQSVQDHAVLTDMGEGKTLNKRNVETPAGASYGCSEFRAPEVHGAQSWSSAADVFSFGVLCCKTLELRARVCQTSLPSNSHHLLSFPNRDDIVPAEIAEIIEGCLRHAPSERPGMYMVMMELDSLSRKIPDEEREQKCGQAELLKQLQWSDWNWKQALAVAQRVPAASSFGQYNTRDSILDE